MKRKKIYVCAPFGGTIDDQIRINYLLDLDARPDVQSVTIEYIGQDLGEAEKTIVVDDIGTLDRVDGKYRCPAILAPAQIGDTVRVTIRTTGGEETLSSSVAKYCRYLLDGDFSDEIKALAAATLEYGQAANDYFANKGLYHPSQITVIEEAVRPANIAQAQRLDDHMILETGGKVGSVSFMVRTKPEFRFYVDPDACDLTAEDFAALNGRIRITDDADEEMQGVDARFVRNAETGAILLEVTGVEAENMDEVIKVTIDGFGTITFCGNDFARILANDASARTLGTALYLYGKVAKACFVS